MSVPTCVKIKTNSDDLIPHEEAFEALEGIPEGIYVQQFGVERLCTRSTGIPDTSLICKGLDSESSSGAREFTGDQDTPPVEEFQPSDPCVL